MSVTDVAWTRAASAVPDRVRVADLGSLGYLGALFAAAALDVMVV